MVARSASRPFTSKTRPLFWVLCALFAYCQPASAQAAAECQPGGYRVLARRWDVALKTGWELRQDCAHPEWPARSSAVSPRATEESLHSSTPAENQMSPISQPLLVHAGDPVRLWMQDNTVRIEISGMAEQSARRGERVIVQITRQNDAGLTVQRVAGIVRGSGDVEMEQ
jgi:Chaperone for flagella basal body P-ring formation